MIRWLKWFRDLIADVVWPSGVMCIGCEDPVEGRLLCEKCEVLLDSTRLHCEGDVRSVWLHKGPARRMVINLKYENVEICAQVLADDMAEVARAMNLPANTVVTWVAMPRVRRLARGIDHGRVLAQAIAERIGLPVEQLLVRTRNVHTQRGLNLKQRLTNLRNCFAPVKKIRGPVLLVDDVFTSGTTTRTCSKILKRAGATKVYVLTATKVAAP